MALLMRNHSSAVIINFDFQSCNKSKIHANNHAHSLRRSKTNIRKM